MYNWYLLCLIHYHALLVPKMSRMQGFNTSVNFPQQSNQQKCDTTRQASRRLRLVLPATQRQLIKSVHRAVNNRIVAAHNTVCTLCCCYAATQDKSQVWRSRELQE